jgi:hypothetical protein
MVAPWRAEFFVMGKGKSKGGARMVCRQGRVGRQKGLGAIKRQENMRREASRSLGGGSRELAQRIWLIELAAQKASSIVDRASSK